MKEGLVIKSTGSRFRVQEADGNITECFIRGKFRTKGIKGTNPVAVGDRVGFIQDGETGIIREIFERKNYIIRKSPNLSRRYQIIASNIDRAVLMVTLKEPETQLEFIDRFLVAAEAFRIPVTIIINKADLYSGELLKEAEQYARLYRTVGYETFLLSLGEGECPEEIRKIFQGKVSLISGNSGVGKSTLINKIYPGFNIRIGEISAYHKQGKHTTTFAEMYPLPGSGYIIDTPGIRGFGLFDFQKEEIYHFFPEIFRISEFCKYHNCLHIDEPDCAVKEAAEQGEIEFSRYRSYINIMLDADSKYR